MRPISVPPSLGFSSVLVISAAVVIAADIIDPSTDGPADATDFGLLTTDGSNPNIIASALRRGTVNSVPGVMYNVIFWSDGAVAQFCLQLIRHHSVQSLVDVFHQCHGRLVISSTYFRTRG